MSVKRLSRRAGLDLEDGSLERPVCYTDQPMCDGGGLPINLSEDISSILLQPCTSVSNKMKSYKARKFLDADRSCQLSVLRSLSLAQMCAVLVQR